MNKMKVEEFCSKMRQWAEACRTPLETDDPEMKEWRKEFEQHWNFISLAIVKTAVSPLGDHNPSAFNRGA